MLEQTQLHGQLYTSYVKGKTLISKPVIIQDVKFGPMRSITIYKEADCVIVRDNRTQRQYMYQNGELTSSEGSFEVTGNGFTYLYGMAQYKNEKHTYFIQNQPIVSIPDTPDIHTFTLPQTLQNLDYRQVFTYPEPLLHLLHNIQAAYTDIYKRPIIQVNGHVFPIMLVKSKTKLQDLKPSTYPIVVNLENTNFAMVDLEPNHTADDLAHFKSLQGYYQEDTPRGGKHLLVPLNSDVYKFRYSPQLEIINESAITIYGINAIWKCDDPSPLNVENYSKILRNVPSTGHHVVYNIYGNKEQQAQVEQYADMLVQLHEKKCTGSKKRARAQYQQDHDTSHGEYMALYILWNQDVKPYQAQLPQALLPWILHAYASDCIEWRDKHDTQRNGVPYLIHLCQRVIDWKQ